MKKLMILGAGVGQVPIIQRAVELGAYVITVDYLPDNVGHRLSHESVDCSTVDQAGVLAAARRLQVDGIVTMASDIAAATVSTVAEQLALPGCSVAAAVTMSNKANFRDFQRRHILPGPGFVVGRSFDEVADAVAELAPPLMFKPVDTSGSRGVCRVDAATFESGAQAFNYAQQFSRSGTVCVEQYVVGTDVSGDGFMVGGELTALVTQKYKQGYVPTGHSLPTDISAGGVASVLKAVGDCCRALGYTDGPIDFDVRVAPERTVVLEMSPRLGGNGIPMLIYRAAGIDLLGMTVKFALGEQVDAPAAAPAVKQPCGSLIFGSTEAGQITGIASASDIRARVPEVFECMVNYATGDKVERFEHSGNGLGYALFDCPPETGYPAMVSKIQSALDLQVADPVAISKVM